MMAEEEPVDIEQELENLLTKVQPNLQDVIKRVISSINISSILLNYISR